jgi:2-polyprenyl-3-methyl-5-hydroxy-6-metoxy-1,4-benzoquinol methylase
MKNDEQIPAQVELEECLCPMGCNPSDTVIMTGTDRLHGVQGSFTIVECNNCGLQRTSPRPTSDTIGTYYPDSYSPYKTQTKVKQSSKLRQLFKFRERELPPRPPGKMLEVGCAGGNYLLEMRNKGWTVEGIEFSSAATEIARSHGLSVQNSTIENALTPEAKFDIVTAWMVIEHLHEPVPALRKMTQWVKDDGYLVASVPDISSLPRKIFGAACYDVDVPRHLFHFNAKTIQNLFKKSGWSVERVYWQRNSVTFIRSLEFYAIEKNWPATISFARWMRFSPRAKGLRFVLAWLLGVTKTSGRIEIWAVPINEDR